MARWWKHTSNRISVEKRKDCTIFEPKPGTEYYEAYMKCVSKGAKKIGTIEELREYLERVI